jgi:predicted double-glycine peptidase
VIELPNTVQATDYTCGAAALLSVSAYYGAGPKTEAEVVRDMGFGEDGSDPAHLVGAAHRYGLHVHEYRAMTDRQLARCLDRGRPVILMLQAWPEKPPLTGFRDVWDSGHWVVAIGHDARGVYFADPSLDGARGVLSHAELDERWHDIEGVEAHHTYRYGVAVWRQRVVNTERLARTKPIT